MQQLLAQLGTGAGRAQGPPSLPPAVHSAARSMLGHSCAVASFSPADSAQLQLLSWLADAQVSRNAITASISFQPFCYAFIMLVQKCKGHLIR